MSSPGVHSGKLILQLKEKSPTQIPSQFENNSVISKLCILHYIIYVTDIAEECLFEN